MSEPGDATRTARTQADSIAGLVRHIVAKHHGFARREIGVIKQLFARCEARELAEPETLAAVRRFFEEMADDMLEHLRKEEERLFPVLLSDSPLDDPAKLRDVMAELDLEHEAAGEALIRLQMPLAEAMLPESDGGPLEELRRHLRLIDKDIKDHVNVERNVLFPQVRKAMEPDAG